ncbi:MAG: hypothetical protein DRO11_03305 [Methanobacteriota archaeon]|nr:MAG: hypothetical protein DRO11_03305 [Euryarchaeota archaeon]
MEGSRRDKINEHLARSASKLALYYEALDVGQVERLKEVLLGKTSLQARRIERRQRDLLRHATDEMVEACVMIGPDKVEKEVREILDKMPEIIVAKDQKKFLLNRLDRIEKEAERLRLKDEQKKLYHCETIAGVAKSVVFWDESLPLFSRLLSSLIE